MDRILGACRRSHNHRVAAATAGEVSAAVLEDPASQVRRELVDKELGQVASVLGSNEQALHLSRSETAGGTRAR
jgi:hypothetical protein